VRPIADPVYVVHSPRLASRREHAERALADLGWTPTWVEGFEPEDIGPLAWIRRVRTLGLTRAEVSVYLKHVEVFRRVARAGGRALVLEDDAVFPDGFARAFEDYVAALPAEWDMAFFGESCRLEIEPEHPGALFGATPATRSMSGYLGTAECSRVLLSELDGGSIRAPIDHTVNEVIRRRALAVYWSIPALIGNGSQSGRFLRSLDGAGWRRHPITRWVARRFER
jgi:GR25 family glycosyltransferase involved in LPS biosynthesis